jgi:multiple sugar transport system substrate-binding protein
MKQWYRHICYVGILLIFGLLLCCIGCNDEDRKNEVTIWSALGGTTGSVLQKIVDNSTEILPGKQTSFLIISQIKPKLNAAIVGNSAPDVVLISRHEVASMAYRHALTPLDSYISESSAIKKEDFFTAAWDEAEYQGTQYAIPINIDSRAFLYNKDLFRAAGLDPEVPPKTWKELEEYAAKLTKYDEKKKIKLLGFLPLFGNDLLYLYAWQCGAKFINDDGSVQLATPEILKAGRWIDGFLNKYGRDTLLRYRDDVGTYDSITNPFLSGKVAMTIEGSWFLSLAEKYAPGFDYGIAMPPYPEGGEACTWSGGYALVIPATAPNKEEAWKLIEHLVSQESQCTLAKEASQIPARKSAAYDETLMQNQKYAQFVELLEYTKYRPKTPICDYLHKLLANDYIERISARNEKSETVLKDIERKVQNQLNHIIPKK